MKSHCAGCTSSSGLELAVFILQEIRILLCFLISKVGRQKARCVSVLLHWAALPLVELCVPAGPAAAGCAGLCWVPVGGWVPHEGSEQPAACLSGVVKKPHSHSTTLWHLEGAHEINQAGGMNLTELSETLWHTGCQPLLAFGKCLVWLLPCTDRSGWPWGGARQHPSAESPNHQYLYLIHEVAHTCVFRPGGEQPCAVPAPKATTFLEIWPHAWLGVSLGHKFPLLL